MGRKKPKKAAQSVSNICYGTKEEMVVKKLKKGLPYKCKHNYNHRLDIVAQDENGYYLTKDCYVGAKLTDPFRMYSRPAVPEEILEELEKPIPAETPEVTEQK